MIDLNTSRGIVLFVFGIVIMAIFVILVWNIIAFIRIYQKNRKLKEALSELNTLPLNVWERKWSKYVQAEYDKLNDPHRDEVEYDIKFFEECRKEVENET